jgi:hypothetical protein
MKHTITTVLSFAALLPAVAQKAYKRVHNDMLDQAKVLLANENYEDAAKLYKRLLPVDSSFAEPFYEMALCQNNIPGQRDKAVPNLEHAAKLGHTEALYELALARHRQMRFDEAVELLRRYRQQQMRRVNDTEVERGIVMAFTAKELVKQPIDARIRNLGAMVNSPAHDYCPVVTADGSTMFFTSRRQGTTGQQKDPTGQWYEDIYTAESIDGVWGQAVKVKGALNTPAHDATVGLSPDGSSMIIFRTKDGTAGGDLYESIFRKGQWQEPVLMTERINSKHHEPSASFAPGGEEIYFTSDRPGGHGGRDIYRIRRLPNGEWSLPLNLGPTVNTPYDEDGPFIHSDGITLYFSSKGHNTMGGYDIFRTTLVDPDMNGWSKPENVGYPLNTVNDDIYFCLSADGNTGWFSSERSGGLGMQDIYQVDFANSQLDYFLVHGVVTDPAEEPVKARMVLTDPLNEEVVGVYNTNERTGRYLMVLSPGRRYTVKVEAPGFLAKETEVTARAEGGSRETLLDLQLTPAEQRLTRNGQ